MENFIVGGFILRRLHYEKASSWEDFSMGRLQRGKACGKASAWVGFTMGGLNNHAESDLYTWRVLEPSRKDGVLPTGTNESGRRSRRAIVDGLSSVTSLTGRETLSRGGVALNDLFGLSAVIST